MESVNCSVSVIGLGDMGSALARALVARGWKTIVWNRSEARCQPLIAAGAIRAPSLKDCIISSQMVIACFSQSTVLSRLLENTESVSSSGRVLVNFSSGTFPEIEQTEQLATERMFSTYIHASIFATPSFVGLSDSVSYYSGDEKAYHSVEPVLKAFGLPKYLGSDTGAARFQEILMGGCFYGFAAGFLQTMATLRFSKRYTPGAAQRLMTDVITPLLTTNFPRTFGELAKQIDERKYVTAGTGVRIGLLAEALENRAESYKEFGMSTLVLRPMLELLQTRIRNGGNVDEEMSSLIEVIAGPTGSPI